MQVKLAKHIKLTPVRILAIGFAVVIFIGAVLLSLPISSIDRNPTPFIDSFFTATSAGFNSISTSDMTTPGRLLTIILMFIGGSSGSTAGGIKTTTFSIIILTVIAIIKGKEDTEVFEKRISMYIVRRSFVITSLASILVIAVTMILSITEAGASFEYIFYEATSAFGTVGLTLGLTTELSFLGKVILSFTMYCGRLGPLTLALALAKIKNNSKIRYPEDKVLVG